MQKCENCNTSFTWSEINKSLWGLLGYKPIECDNCGAEHKITFFGRLTVVALTILPMSITGNYLIFFTSLNSIIAIPGIGLSVLFIGSSFAPYLVRYKIV